MTKRPGSGFDPVGVSMIVTIGLARSVQSGHGHRLESSAAPLRTLSIPDQRRDNLEFIGVWEQIHNPDFKGLEFETFKNQAGLNSFSLTPRKWIEATGAIGFQSKAGRYGGGTYAHKDIAFEFGSWLSPEFKLYLIKEFQRLKDDENDRRKLDWNLQRTLAKIN